MKCNLTLSFTVIKGTFEKIENGQYYNFDTLVSELEIYLKGEQTEEHWVKIGNGIPLNEIFPHKFVY